MPRARIGTLLLLVVIAGLVIALAAERRRHAEALADEKRRSILSLDAIRAEMNAMARTHIKSLKESTAEILRLRSDIQDDRKEIGELRARLKDR